MNIEDVIWDVQYLCFESLNLRDLISLAQTNQHFSALSQYIFVRKHSKKNIRAVITEINATDRIINLSTLIILRSHESTVNILKTFGHLITGKLELLLSYAGDVNITEISYFLNSNCADTLKEIRIEIRHQDFFEVMTKPFKNLEILEMEGSTRDLGSSTLTFSELFPAIKHLNLKSLQINNKSCIDDHFEHLEHLDIRTLNHSTTDFHEFNAEDVEKCLRKNPQIRSLVLHKAKRPILDISSRVLPHLDSLELSCFKNDVSDDQEIIFESVANLTIGTFSEKILRNITFRNLTEFHTYMDIGGAPAIIQFVEEKPLLKKLYIHSFIHATDLQRLAVARLNIEEIYMEIMNSADDQELALNFIRSNQHMRKIRVNNNVCNKIDEEKLHHEFSDKWIITSGQETILLTRRD